MNGTEIRRLNGEDAAEYQALCLGTLQAAPTAFAADHHDRGGDAHDCEE
jgi:hypothetical protein